MGFSFTATAQCDYCGELLGSSDEECNHNGASVKKRLFRRIGGGRESLIAVKSCPEWKWHKLAEAEQDDWIAYEYLGTKDHVNTMLEQRMWQSVADLPKMQMCADAPDDVHDHIEENE